jgi:hypothetical protein
MNKDNFSDSAVQGFPKVSNLEPDNIRGNQESLKKEVYDGRLYFLQDRKRRYSLFQGL